jgi:predicted membrane protein
VSSVPHSEPRRADHIAGFLCAFALALSLVAIARKPALLAPTAILVALVAARMSEAHRKLAAWAVAVATVAFVIGMTVSIATDNALF